MLLFLVNFLVSIGIKVPAAFSNISTRMILASIVSLLITILSGPLFIKWLYEKKIGQPIRKEDCPTLAQLHAKKQDTPTMGGLLILTSILVSSLLFMELTHPFTHILLFAMLAFGAIGVADDWLKLKHRNSKGIRSRTKLFFQILFAACIALFFVFKFGEFQSYFIPFIKSPFFIGGGLFTVAFSIFVIAGASNAVNFTDGLDGLASGCLIPVTAVLALFAFLSNHVELCHYLNLMYIPKSSEIAIFLCATSSGSLGFLWYNGFPAQVFMGDTGSLSLGAIVGSSAMLLRREFLLVILGGIFVMEVLSVIIQVASYRFRNKKRVFLCSPLHHHFEYKGWAETKVVLRFWIVGLLLAAIATASIKFQ
jgi:phospho-N-acetylmuramoyl-pentapeptide-transferase